MKIPGHAAQIWLDAERIYLAVDGKPQEFTDINDLISILRKQAKRHADANWSNERRAAEVLAWQAKQPRAETPDLIDLLGGLR